MRIKEYNIELLFENDDDPTKLRILDFDDTIADTVEQVIITHTDPDGTVSYKPISSKEFAVYELQPGESIDPDIAFQEFSRVDIEKATPVPLITDLLRKFASAEGRRKLLILTARGQEVADDVMAFLERKVGISDPAGKIDFRGVNSKDPAAKVMVIESYLDDYPNIQFVSFYDDSGQNVKAVAKFLDDRGIKRDVRQVVTDEEGNVRLVPPRIDEGTLMTDFGLLTRNFLRGIVVEDNVDVVTETSEAFDERGLTRDFFRRMLSEKVPHAVLANIPG